MVLGRQLPKTLKVASVLIRTLVGFTEVTEGVQAVHHWFWQTCPEEQDPLHVPVQPSVAPPHLPLQSAEHVTQVCPWQICPDEHEP
jgi:hypothetical protein